uniref:Uncharacterized protein n=1 Tax=Cucumis melo TaxID=3656 RepID=A0A9I9EMB2_CUCME
MQVAKVWDSFISEWNIAFGQSLKKEEITYFASLMGTISFLKVDPSKDSRNWPLLRAVYSKIFDKKVASSSPLQKIYCE